MTGPAILLFRGRGLISSLIRWQTRSVYSHAAILLPDGETIIEAWQGDGVRKKKITDWSNVDVFYVALTPDQWELVLEFAEAQVGKGYDYRQVLRFATRIKPRDNSKWFCSELVFSALQSAGARPLSRVKSSAVSPGMLAWSPILTEAISADYSLIGL